MVALRAVCVFCGSSTPSESSFGEAARSLGVLLARNGIRLVYGAGSTGLMGDLANAALAHGGHVTGVIPVGIFSREEGHTGLTELHQVRSMHERKQLMYDLSDGFIALPGGLGTLEEVAEVTTWSHLGLHSKPVVLLDVETFWEPLLSQLDRMVGAGLLRKSSRSLIQRASSAEEALDALGSAEPSLPEKWISEEER